MAQTNYVYNQILAGTVDGVNKVFTSPQPIDAIEDMRLGGVSYSDFSFTQGSTTVTLTDAPTTGTGAPYVDFFVYGVTPVPVGTTVTFKDVRDSLYLKIGHESTSEQFPVALVDEALNEASRVLNNGRLNPKLKLSSFSFNPTGDILVSEWDGMKLEVGTIPTGTPATGAIIVSYASPVPYTGVTSTAFTGLSGMNFVPKASANVNVGYALPSSCKKVGKVWVDGTDYSYMDFREFTNGLQSHNSRTRRFTVWMNPADSQEYLFLSTGIMGDSVVTVHHTTVNAQYDSDEDVVDFEPEYRHVIVLYAAYKVLQSREDDRWQTFKQEYAEEYQKYKAYLRRTEGSPIRIITNVL